MSRHSNLEVDGEAYREVDGSGLRSLRCLQVRRTNWGIPIRLARRGLTSFD